MNRSNGPESFDRSMQVSTAVLWNVAPPARAIHSWGTPFAPASAFRFMTRMPEPGAGVTRMRRPPAAGSSGSAVTDASLSVAVMRSAAAGV